MFAQSIVVGFDGSQNAHRALEAAGGNVSRAAESCGMTRAALQRIMRQLAIEREAFR